jgi:hypothetical protein
MPDSCAWGVPIHDAEEDEDEEDEDEVEEATIVSSKRMAVSA